MSSLNFNGKLPEFRVFLTRAYCPLERSDYNNSASLFGSFSVMGDTWSDRQRGFFIFAARLFESLLFNVA